MLNSKFVYENTREPAGDNVDAQLGMDWWNSLTRPERDRWMQRAGNTGVAADAWEAFKAARHSGDVVHHPNSRPARAVLAALLLSLPACSTLEMGADHARNFAARHPALTAVAVAAVGAGIYALAHRHDGPRMPVRRPNAPVPCTHVAGSCPADSVDE